jgi:hypothetical protein
MFVSRFNQLQMQAGIEVDSLFKSFLNNEDCFLKRGKTENRTGRAKDHPGSASTCR